MTRRDATGSGVGSPTPARPRSLAAWVAPQNEVHADQFFRIDLEQRIGGAVTGGCTYALAIKKKEAVVH